MSCVTVSSTNPCDCGTAVITLSFTDENGEAFVPLNAEWQLSNKAGDIINNQDFASNNLTSTQVILTGDDLALASNMDSGERWFAVRGTYDSTIGGGLSFIGELKFTIQDVLNV